MSRTSTRGPLARTRRASVRRCVKARAIAFAILLGVAVAALTDLGIRRLCPPSAPPLQWKLRPRSAANVSLSVGQGHFPAMEFQGLWSEHMKVWSGKVPPPGSMFAGPGRSAPPRWSSLAVLTSGRRGEEMSYEGSAFGFPFRSSTREVITDAAPPGSAASRGGLRFTGVDPTYVVHDAAGYRFRAVRVRIIGALANAALWTCVFAGAYTLATGWRRHRRRGRGLCERCGYDLRGLKHQSTVPAHAATCPECGYASHAAMSLHGSPSMRP